jgi:hypothetical protein
MSRMAKIWWQCRGSPTLPQLLSVIATLFMVRTKQNATKSTGGRVPRVERFIHNVSTSRSVAAADRLFRAMKSQEEGAVNKTYSSSPPPMGPKAHRPPGIVRVHSRTASSSKLPNVHTTQNQISSQQLPNKQMKKVGHDVSSHPSLDAPPLPSLPPSILQFY